MHECEKYQELISLAADGELTESQQAELDAHLETCDACRALLEMFSELWNQPEPEAVPPADFTANVMEAVRRAPAPRKKSKDKVIFLRYAAAAACVAVVLLAAIPSLLSRSDSVNDAAAGGSAPESCAADVADADGAAPMANGSNYAQYSMNTTGADDAADEEVLTSDALTVPVAVMEISGPLPAPLVGRSQTEMEPGVFHIYVDAATAQELLDLGFAFADPDLFTPDGEVLVIYHAQRS